MSKKYDKTFKDFGKCTLLHCKTILFTQTMWQGSVTNTDLKHFWYLPSDAKIVQGLLCRIVNKENGHVW